MSSDGYCSRDQMSCRDVNKVVYDPVHHDRLRKCPSLLEGLPMEFGHHCGVTAGSSVVSHDKSG